MASNNQRAPSAPPPQRWSNESKKNSKEHQKLILFQVKEMFGSILEPEIILSVVQNCKWKLQPSIDALIMLSENAEVPFNRASRNSAPKSEASSSSSSRMSKSLNREETWLERKTGYKSNLDQENTGSGTKSGTNNSYLNLNDIELQRQKEEFRKFELLKKDLAEKGFIPPENENVSKPSYFRENDKIPQPKLQQFGQTWSSNFQAAGKGDSAKVYFCSEVENSAVNQTTNQLWGNPNITGSKKSKETNSQLENLFGSKLQFSRDSPENKIANKGTIPKNSKPQANVDPAIISAAKSSSKPPNAKGNPDYNSADFTHDFEESKAHQQQVAQFDSNYDNETKVRAGSGKSSIHKGDTESLCGLKVQYRLPGLENSSDDDADVVIEEESLDYPTQIPTLMSINVCQFISSSNEIPPKNNTRSEISPAGSPQHNTYDDKLKKITSSILDGYKVLVIIRGLSGSGKTHLATSIVRSTVGGDKNQFVFSSDDYFVMLGRGVYQYVRSKLTEAHKYNQKRAFSALREGVSPVIIDNTNSQSWEMQPYVVTGVQNGYMVEVLEPNTPWCKNLNELARKNSHGVLKESIRKMMDRYELNLTGAKLIEQFSLRYSAENFPPQMRRFPFFGEGQEKNEKLKASANKNRNRRKKRNPAAAAAATNSDSNSSDTMNYLLSDSDKNMKHTENSSNRSMNPDNTLENIVSNALMAENDTLNKSLVDYCIETDSGDEIDSDKVPQPVENGLDDNTSFDLLDYSDKTEIDNNPSAGNREENAQQKSDSKVNDSSTNTSNSTSFSSIRKNSNILHQNLGAIGSERKGSVTAIDCESFLQNQTDKEKDSNSQENVLSQCWDFTLLVNGREIHSTAPKRKSDFNAKFKNIDDPKKETDSEKSAGVIITEIVDEVVFDELKNVTTKIDDTESAITNILKKMDAPESKSSPENEVDSLKSDSTGTDPTFQEVKSAPVSRGASNMMRSIFDMMKRTIVGSNSDEEVEEGTESEESIMKYKRQTNDNSLSENDAFENEKSHREPSAVFILDDKEPEDDLSPSLTIVGDSLSQKLLDVNLSSGENKLEEDSRRVSKLTGFDTLGGNEGSEFMVEDNLSGKISEILESVCDETRNCCVLTNVELKHEPETNEENNCCSIGSDERREENLLEIDIEEDPGSEIPNDNNDYQNEDVTGAKGTDFFCDILSEAVNRIISRQETESILRNEARDGRNSFSDDEESESSQTESSYLISKGTIVDEEEKTRREGNELFEILDKEEIENIDESLNKTEEINSRITEDSKTESAEVPVIDSDFCVPEKATLDQKKESILCPENDLEDNSSTEQCCECCDCCESPTISDTERNIDEGAIPEVEDVDELSNSDKIPDIIDNINQVTWKEPPFPVPIETLNSLLEKSRKLEAVVKSDSSTNTSNYDFNVLYVGGTSEPEYKILNTKKRDINSSPTISRLKETPLKLMLDKSSMTRVVDILSGEESLESITDTEPMKELKRLKEMFPNLSREDIKEIYENLCSCNFNWAVDMILDGVPEHVTKYSKIEAPKIALGERQASGSDQADIESQNSTPRRERLDRLRQQSTSSESNSTDSKFQPNSSPRKKKDRHKLTEEALELKRQVEEKMVINEASYNPHILRVKRWKNGEPDVAIDSSKEEKISPQISIDNNELDNQSPKSSESNDEFTEDDLEPEEMIELNLGQDFIKVLENEFGNPEFQFPGGIFPVIQIKKSMARQIHALWIESMDQQLNAQQEQLDIMIEKDAEYARSLEQEEARSLCEPSVPNLSEIMDMEMALALYHNDLKKKLESETPNDMASRLTRQMLHEMFTDNDPETLDEILKAHNGKFKETVEVLEASTGQVVNRNNTLRKQKSLIDRAKRESLQSDEEEFHPRTSTSTVVVNPELGQSGVMNSTLTYDAAMEEARISRMDAERQLVLRNENFNKAQEAIRRGDRDVAGYYSQMAKLHAKQRELANATAASAFLAAQDYKMTKEQMRENTLDLHNLYVAEALQALEVFLDYQISRLNEGNKRSMNLYIITGRGARSSNGMSRIKPAVSRKLASKNIRFMDDNPGCLKVVIHRRSGAAG